MTSYKLCLTVLVLAGVSVTANCLYDPSHRQRIRRANANEERPSEVAPVSSEVHGLRAGYRFGDEYFLPEASKSIPTEYKTRANGCERVIKDSMVCMVCKDPKTNEKYEQCSYVAQPNEKAFTYAKSSAFGIPDKENQRINKNEDSPESSAEAYESSESPRKSHNYENDSRKSSRYENENSNEESDSSRDPAESSNCRQVKKNGETCTICKDPDTGRDIERCSSSYRPDDKSYSIEKSGKYGDYPESQEEKEEYNSRNDESHFESSEDPAESSDCRQIQKDGQTCTVCKDPKTGSDLERCSSSYRPDDKAYSYGKSEKYSYPHSDDENENYKTHDEDESSEGIGSYESSPSEFQAGYLKSNDDNYRRYHDGEPEELREGNYDGPKIPSYEESSSAEYTAPTIAAETKRSSETKGETDCREVQKDSMSCTVCTDPKTGGNFQKCSYAYKPNDKVYKFSKSKTFGYPEIEKGNSDNGDAAKISKGSSDYVRESETKQVPDAVKASPCKQVQRESKTCTICEDPITGESSEQCAYSYKPKEKHFAYSKSKSFASPGNEKKGRDGGSTEEGQQESRQVPRWSDEGESVRSEKNVDATEASPCKQVLKDSMTCTICHDPKTGGSSEQCAYSSEPKEKLFTYSKSKTFASPQKSGKESGRQESRNRKFVVEPEKEDEPEKIEDSAEASPCKQVLKDSMTCTICKDPKTGENSEQCAYSSKPKERHFTYSKSKSFGSPRKSGEERQESRQAPRRLDDGPRDFVSDNRPRGFSKTDRGFDL